MSSPCPVTKTLHYYLLLALLAMTIVVSLKAVGIILVIAMLITPGAVAYLLTDSFDRMLTIADRRRGHAPSALGTIVSFHVDGATGACIVLIQFVAFVAGIPVRAETRVCLATARVPGAAMAR